ncbi:MAG TPA: chromate transporter [Thermoflexales bacterium]|nr:chromate transporter [Thermoflexales bacterium]HQW35060.1 chromate transporter [Thermoflexales bacterium]HQZ99914.1 chromate transporter [Thermoflexales bacterium]
MDWLTYFALMLKACLLSTGGRGPFPYLYADFLSHGWATDANFAEALSVGEISPGPSGLWVISFGYLTGGLTGALLALVAVTLPPLGVLLVSRIHQKLKDLPATQGVLDGLVLAIVGTAVVVLANLFVKNGLDPVTVGIFAASAVLMYLGRIPSIFILLGAAIAGVLLL